MKESPSLNVNSTITQMKVFRFRELDKVEAEINDWLSREKVVVRHITQSQSENQGWFEFVISVFYEDPHAGHLSS